MSQKCERKKCIHIRKSCPQLGGGVRGSYGQCLQLNCFFVRMASLSCPSWKITVASMSVQENALLSIRTLRTIPIGHKSISNNLLYVVYYLNI